MFIFRRPVLLGGGGGEGGPKIKEGATLRFQNCTYSIEITSLACQVFSFGFGA